MKAADYIQILIDSGLKWAELWDKEFQGSLMYRLCSRWGCNGHVKLCFLQTALYTNIVHSGVPFFVMRLIRYVR